MPPITCLLLICTMPKPDLSVSAHDVQVPEAMAISVPA